MGMVLYGHGVYGYGLVWIDGYGFAMASMGMVWHWVEWVWFGIGVDGYGLVWGSWIWFGIGVYGSM